eukprot:806725-Pyramimonas_sp.AAC.1
MYRTLEEHEAKFGAVDISHGETTQKKVTLDLKSYMVDFTVGEVLSPRILKMHPEASRNDIDLC